MAYEYDRFEREDGGGSFLMGLLAGTVLGAGLGMLFAPKAGLRAAEPVAEQARHSCATTANDAYSQASEKVSQIVDRGRKPTIARAPAAAQHRRRAGQLGTTGGDRRHRRRGTGGTAPAATAPTAASPTASASSVSYQRRLIADRQSPLTESS